ncbi:meiotic nuclear division protein 1, partial [Pisolithus albus]
APRGLSAEEKRVKLLEIFHESVSSIISSFQLKELEKLGPKLKGIVSQTVKEVLQSLVDDRLVQTDKIGSSNFFWSFPSERGNVIRNRLDAANNAKSHFRGQLQDLNTSLEREKSARPESEKRMAGLEKLQALKENIKALEKELNAYGVCHPAKVEAKKRAVVAAHEAAVRWTDNYTILLAYFTRQNGSGEQEIRNFLDIEENYEDIY